MLLLFALHSLSPPVVATAAGSVMAADWRDRVAVLDAEPTMPRAATILIDLRRSESAVPLEDMGWMAVLLHRLIAGRVALPTATVGHAAPVALMASYADAARCLVQTFTGEPTARVWPAVGT